VILFFLLTSFGLRSFLKIELDLRIIAVGGSDKSENSGGSLWLASSPTTISRKGNSQNHFKELLGVILQFAGASCTSLPLLFVLLQATVARFYFFTGQIFIINVFSILSCIKAV
jgi:hypothetical protein